MKDIFKPDDFIEYTYGNYTLADDAAKFANRLLKERIFDNGVVAYNKAFGINWRAEHENGNGVILGQQEDDMWKALLICVEPIEKKKCENHGDTHWPNRMLDHDIQKNNFTCSCGAKLKATWSEA
jgi:hypothetical protein